MDNGAQKSLAGLPAYKRYCAFIHFPIDLAPSKEKFKFGDITHESLGSTVIRFPVDAEGNYLEYETYVVNLDLPILFGLDKMKKHKWYVNEVTNELCNYDQPDMKMQLTFKKGHLYLEWNTKYAFFSKSDLLKMNKRFAHPTAEKLAALLRRA